MKVLVAEDSTTVLRSMIRVILLMDGVEIVGRARTASEGIALTDDMRPDVVVLSISLSQGSGFDVLRHIREKKMATHVILLADSVSEQYRHKGLKEGADMVFDKATEIDKIVEAVGLQLDV